MKLNIKSHKCDFYCSGKNLDGTISSAPEGESLQHSRPGEPGFSFLWTSKSAHKATPRFTPCVLTPGKWKRSHKNLCVDVYGSSLLNCGKTGNNTNALPGVNRWTNCGTSIKWKTTQWWKGTCYETQHSLGESQRHCAEGQKAAPTLTHCVVPCTWPSWRDRVKGMEGR